MELKVKLQTFEGPLDLLLHLIDKNKVNIYDIPISEITNQYMDYIGQMQEENLNVMSEFLVMAATLLDIKSKMLLPIEEDEEGKNEDPRAELVEQLLEYKMFKYISMELRDRQMDAEKNIYKEPTLPKEVLDYAVPVDLEKLCQDVTLSKLNEIFKTMMKRQVDRIDPVRSGFGKIEKEEISLDNIMIDLESYAEKHKTFSFRGLLEQAHSKMEIIVAFLAVLELMKVGKILIKQDKLFDDIEIHSLIAA